MVSQTPVRILESNALIGIEINELCQKLIPVRPQFSDVLAIAASADLLCSQLGESYRSVVELSFFLRNLI